MMKLYWQTKKNHWKLDWATWWKQFLFGIWWDSMGGNTQVTIYFGFWCIDIWKNHRAEIIKTEQKDK